MQRRSHILLAVLSLIFIALPIAAQVVRDYVITDIRHELRENDTLLVLIVGIENQGADAIAETDARVTLVTTGEVLLRDALPPLEAGQFVTLEIPLAVSEFEAGTTQEIEVSIGVDGFELPGSQIAEDNVAVITAVIPDRGAAPAVTGEWIAWDGETIIIFGQPYTRVQIALAAAATVAILLMLWLVTIVMRLLFRKPDQFANWQPPYGVMPIYDQNSIDGRRWAWQQHAQNNLLLAAPEEGNIHPVKLLTGANGANLSQWRVTALRLSQYDNYGRIARTQAFASGGSIRRFNRILGKRANKDEAQLQKMLRPIVRDIVKRFVRKVQKKTAFLPIAYDMRLEGKHGEVRIFFELYQCQQNVWYRIDRWEPVMQILTPRLQENMTFTIHGKSATETLRDFRERLYEDVMWLLLEAIRLEDDSAPDVPQPEPQAPRPQYNVPDTLSGMDPIPETAHPATPPTDA